MNVHVDGGWGEPAGGEDVPLVAGVTYEGEIVDALYGAVCLVVAVRVSERYVFASNHFILIVFSDGANQFTGTDAHWRQWLHVMIR